MGWYPQAKRNPASRNGGPYITGVPWRGVIHTTESHAFHPGNTYYGHDNWPHFTITRQGEVWQHLDTDVAARALANPSGGVQTNRHRAVQVELVAYARQQPGGLTGAQADATRAWMRWVEKAHGIQPAGQRLSWSGSGAYGTAAPQRMSASHWRGCDHWCGHQHVPENAHWDPGALDIEDLLEEAGEMFRTLHKGDTGDGVRRMQIKLRRLGHKIEVDGIYGPNTIKALDAEVGANGTTYGPWQDDRLDLKLRRQDAQKFASRVLTQHENKVAHGGSLEHSHPVPDHRHAPTDHTHETGDHEHRIELRLAD